ncbi:MAG: AraC family transcriptional regulator ligand-binding domain-containing protein [Myxococcota bacterium]
MADTVLSVASRAVVDACRELGLDVDGLLKGAGLTLEDVEDTDRRLPAARADALWAAACARADDPFLGLHAAEALPFGAYKVVDFLCAHSTTVGEAYHRVARYFQLVDVRAILEPSDEPHSVTMRTRDGIPVPPPAQEYTFAALIGRMAQCAGEGFRPESVELSYAAPDPTSEHARVLMCEPSFDADLPRICFSVETWSMPIRRADPLLARVLEDHAERLVAELPVGDDVVSRTRSAIVNALPDGAPNAARVAKALAMSERTLHRRLKEADRPFGNLLDEARFAAAKAHLADRALSLAEVAWLVGFSDQSAFTRAFRRWSGGPPGKWRAGR